MARSTTPASLALCLGVLAGLSLPAGSALAQRNWQQQQAQQQQAQQRQQMQEQQRQQMQAQQRHQMQAQQRQQMQAQQRQQLQQQQQAQQRQQMQAQQQTQQRQAQQRQQIQQQGKPGTMQAGKPTGMVIAGGMPVMKRPLTPGEIQRGFTGRTTSDGRALINFQGRVFAVPASRVSPLSASAGRQSQQPAPPWSAQKHSQVTASIRTLATSTPNAAAVNARHESARLARLRK